MLSILQIQLFVNESAQVILSLLSHTLGLQRGASKYKKKQELMQEMETNSGTATIQVSKQVDPGLLMFLKGFITSVFNVSRTPLSQKGCSN